MFSFESIGVFDFFIINPVSFPSGLAGDVRLKLAELGMQIVSMEVDNTIFIIGCDVFL